MWLGLLTISDGWRADCNGVVAVVVDDTAGGGAATYKGVAAMATAWRRRRAATRNDVVNDVTAHESGDVDAAAPMT